MDLNGKIYFITGVANKKSVATHVAKALIENGASCIFSAQNEDNLKQIHKIFPESPSFILDVKNEDQIKGLANEIKKYSEKIDGFLHSIAFAKFDLPPKAFHETPREYFLEATQISSFSLVEIANALKNIINKDGSVVTISISNTKATSYGYLGPVKAMLENTVCYLAKSFSEFSKIRFNSVGAGPLKTSASAGIPDYIDNYLYSEELTLRKENLKTEEVAQTALFLLSNKSSGINAQNIIVDAGMSSNYFEQKVVKGFMNNN
jgi:enoyl-[acyl-carrier protein] reductase I